MENNLDKLFKSKLEGQEPDFHPAAWDRMEGLLDDAGMVPIQKKKKSRMIFVLILFFGLLFSIAGYLTIDPSQLSGEGSPRISVEAPMNVQNKTSNNASKTEEDIQLRDQKKDQTAPNVLSEPNLRSETNSTLKPNFASKATSSGTRPVGSDNLLRRTTSTSTFKESSFNKIKTLEENSGKDTNESSTSQSFKGNDAITVLKGNDRNWTSIDNDPTLNSKSLQEDETASEGDLQWTSFIDPKVKDVNLEVEPGINLTIKALDLLAINTSSIDYPKRFIIPQIDKLEKSLFVIGFQSAIRFNDGVGYTIGPSLSYAIGQGYSLNTGVLFDSQNFGRGPEMSVFDKAYSFGSTLSERKFSLNIQRSIRLPLSISKGFRGYHLLVGLMLNKELSTGGSINTGDINTAESAIIDSEMINPTTISFQIGASASLSRYFELGIGIEYRPKPFSADPSISNNKGKFYPSLSLGYKLFKF